MKTQQERGLYDKFFVERTDGRDQEGGDRQDSQYFVLDYVHDPYAVEALKFYAHKCKDEYPELSKDIWMKLREAKRNVQDG